LKRIVLLFLVAVMMAAMMVVAAPAFATIHPLSNSECSNASASVVATEQNPPGVSGGSNADNFAKPVLSASGGDPFTEETEPKPSPAFKTSGPTVADLDADFCPKPK
jgi:hypothetical protein